MSRDANGREAACTLSASAAPKAKIEISQEGQAMSACQGQHCAKAKAELLGKELLKVFDQPRDGTKLCGFLAVSRSSRSPQFLDQGISLNAQRASE